MDKLLEGLLVTGFSMFIVFAVLIILQYIIKLQTFLLKGAGNKKNAGTTNKIESNEEHVHGESALNGEEENEEEIVAVIMAAISAQAGVPISQLRIRSIKRAEGSSWRKSAL